MKLFGSTKSKSTQKEEIIYKPHSIDTVILEFLQKRDEGSFGSKDKIFFFKELAYLVAGGVGIAEAVQLIHDNSDNFVIKNISKSIGQFLHEGKSLSYAISRLPEYFNEGDANIIKVGETSGNIVTILKSLAEEYEYINKIKNKYIGALTYPIILVVIALASVIGLFTFVLPSIFKVIATFPGIEIPTTTRVLQSISNFMVNQWKTIAISISSVSIVSIVFFSTDVGKRIFYSGLLSLPIIGKMTKYYYLIKRCRYMKLMVGSGMSYVETFTLLRDILRIPAYQRMIENVLAGLQRGEPIYDSLKLETDILPPNVPTLIKVGEESASLYSSIQNILNIYTEELNSIIGRLSKIIEPIMLVFIGAIIMVISLGVFGLIYQIMDSAGL